MDILANVKRQIAGRRSKVTGSLFEKYMSAACEYYRELNLAFIEKTPEPFHITAKGKDGVVKGYYEKHAQPDYKGILCDGTGIMFEAKHTDSDKIQQSAVLEHQAESLDCYERMGAQCFVMVSMGLVKFYRVPWKIWKSMKDLFGHKYMNEQELKPYELKLRECKILILEGVEINAD